MRAILPGCRSSWISAQERDGSGTRSSREAGCGRNRSAGPEAIGARARERSGPTLSTRELEVLQLIVNGKSNKEIGLILGVSFNTVAVHRANIMQALGIHNTAELVVYAMRNGLVSTP